MYKIFGQRKLQVDLKGQKVYKWTQKLTTDMPVSLQFIPNKHKSDHRDTGGQNISGCKLSGSSHTGTNSVDTLILG